MLRSWKSILILIFSNFDKRLQKFCWDTFEKKICLGEQIYFHKSCMEKGFSFYVFMNTYQVRRNRGQMPHQYLGKTVVKSKDLQCTYVLYDPPIFRTFQCPCLLFSWTLLHVKFFLLHVFLNFLSLIKHKNWNCKKKLQITW